MAEFQRWITPLQRSTVEPLPTGGAILHEDIPHGIDDIGPLLYSLFHEHWHQVQLSHVVEGSVLELEFSGKPKICILYDGYLTIVTETWHGHLCLEEHGGGPLKTTPEKLRMERRIQRASLYRRCNEQGEARSWGIQFWNGGGEKMMTIFLPNPYVTDLDEDLLPETKPQIEKLARQAEIARQYRQLEADREHSQHLLWLVRRDEALAEQLLSEQASLMASDCLPPHMMLLSEQGEFATEAH